MSKSTHRIEDISYSQDYLLCNCGWEGKALDEDDYKTHKRTSPPTDKLVPVATVSVYNRSVLRPAKTPTVKQVA